MSKASLYTPVSALLVLLLVGCGDDDDLAPASPRELLVAIAEERGEDAWVLSYDEFCRLERVEFRKAPPAAIPPRAYLNPLGFSSNGRELSFAYGEDGELSGVRLTDSVFRNERIREYEVLRSDKRIVGLEPTAEFFGGNAVEPAGVSIRYAYDEGGRIDSTLYSDGNSIDYRFDDLGDLVEADYRAFTEGRPTIEFYGYQMAAPNPLADLPLHYVMTYAGYWAPRLPADASFDLRSYSFVTDGGQLQRHTDLTFGDTASVSTYVYELRVCE